MNNINKSLGFSMIFAPSDYMGYLPSLTLEPRKDEISQLKLYINEPHDLALAYLVTWGFPNYKGETFILLYARDEKFFFHKETNEKNKVNKLVSLFENTNLVEHMDKEFVDQCHSIINRYKLNLQLNLQLKEKVGSNNRTKI